MSQETKFEGYVNEENVDVKTLKRSKRFGGLRPLLFIAIVLLLFAWLPFNRIQRGATFSLPFIGKNVTGSGRIVSEGRELSGFDQIALHGAGEIILTQSDRESVVVETDDNLMRHILTQVNGDRLEIKFPRNTNLVPSGSIKYYISVKEIEEISIDGFGSVVSEEINGENLSLTLDGAGSITLSNVSMENVESDINGLGSIKLLGEVQSQQVDINGSGEYDGDQLESKYAQVAIDGLANASIAVEDDLEVTINGAGVVSYSGNPVVDKEVHGLGRVRRMLAQ